MTMLRPCGWAEMKLPRSEAPTARVRLSLLVSSSFSSTLSTCTRHEALHATQCRLGAEPDICTSLWHAKLL